MPKSIVAFGLLLLSALVAAGTHACDTPVYRYAMYKWQPTPYEVYFFHDGTAESAGEEFAAKIAELNRSETSRTNVVYLPVDLSKDPYLRGVPTDVTQAFLWHRQRRVPSHMVVSPLGEQLFYGDLAAGDVAALADSLARQEIARQLESGKATVLVLLTGSDAKANDEAEAVAAQVVKDIGGGKVQLYSAPARSNGLPGEPPIENEDSPDAEENPLHEVSFIKVDRNDPKERWLVDSLLSVEGDLREEQFESQPMVFSVYGRARALPPFIGRGISRENLLDVVSFVTGACSCTVKEQNPGVDLLVRYDWETASAKVAEKFGQEEGNETVFGPDQFFPELIVGSGNTVGTQPETNPPVGDVEPENSEPAVATIDNIPPKESDDGNDSASEVVNTAPSVAIPTVKVPTESYDDGESSGKFLPRTSEPAANIVATNEGDETQVALSKQPSSSAGSEAESEPVATSSSMILTVAIGIGIALFVMIGATLVLFRPR